jgi:hypothetical protein
MYFPSQKIAKDCCGIGATSVSRDVDDNLDHRVDYVPDHDLTIAQRGLEQLGGRVIDRRRQRHSSDEIKVAFTPPSTTPTIGM